MKNLSLTTFSSRFLLLSLASLMVFASCSETTKAKKSGDELFNDYFEPYTFHDDVRGARPAASLAEAEVAQIAEAEAAEAEMKAVLASGMSAYRSRDFQKAATYLEKYVASNPANLQVPFYLGISHLALDKVDKAESSFGMVLNNSNALYFEHSQWYKSLILLNSEKFEECKNLLDKIVDADGHYYREQAIQLLGQVEYMIEYGTDY